MKSFIILGTFLLASAASGQIFAPGRKTSSKRSGRDTQTIDKVCNDASKSGKRFCGSDSDPPCDAQSVYHCSGVGQGLTYDCVGSLPYCTSASEGAAKCSNVRDPNCKPKIADFSCTGKGVFPDPSDCKLYYYCYVDESDSLVAEQYFCDDRYVFDPSGPKNEYCRLTNNLYCTTAKCDGKAKNVLLSYTFFPKALGQIVVSCRTGEKAPYVFRCDAGFLANLNTLPVQCDMTCTGALKRAYPDDSTKYYECIYTGKKWEGKVKSCFKGYYFDATKKQCFVNPTTSTMKTTTTTATTTEQPATEVEETTIVETSTLDDTATVTAIEGETTTVEASTLDDTATVTEIEGDTTTVEASTLDDTATVTAIEGETTTVETSTLDDTATVTAIEGETTTVEASTLDGTATVTEIESTSKKLPSGPENVPAFPFSNP